MNDKVVGGNLAAPARFDYTMAFIKATSDSSELLCGGTLVTPSLVITSSSWWD